MFLNYCFDFNLNDDYDDGVEFTYEPNDERVKTALVEILCSRLKYRLGNLYSADGAEAMANFIINDLEDIETFKEQYYEDLKDWFYEDAKIAYKDECEFAEDEKSWFGTKKDILGR